MSNEITLDFTRKVRETEEIMKAVLVILTFLIAGFAYLYWLDYACPHVGYITQNFTKSCI